MAMLSDAILKFLEAHSGETFTAAELWKRVPRHGRVFPCHIQQALERRLFPRGDVAASKVYLDEDDEVFPVKAFADTRWCARMGAPQGFLVYDLIDGICEYDPEEIIPVISERPKWSRP